MLAAAADLHAAAANAASAASALDTHPRATATSAWTAALAPAVPPPVPPVSGAASPRCASHRPPKMAALLPLSFKCASRMASSAERKRSHAALAPSPPSSRSLRNCSQATTAASPSSAYSVAGGWLVIPARGDRPAARGRPAATESGPGIESSRNRHHLAELIATANDPASTMRLSVLGRGRPLYYV
eukprot:scaffold263_cov120-Isochrysis_galbana.AAC.8